MKRPAFEVRSMETVDLARASELSAQLGYAHGGDALATRFARICASPTDALLVAAPTDPASRGAVLGWLHVQERCLLEAPPFAEIAGLVVDAASRRAGAGRALVTAAVEWASARGLGRVVVRSNVVRDAAHAFYPSVGFALAKTQHVYERVLLLDAGGASA